MIFKKIHENSFIIDGGINKKHALLVSCSTMYRLYSLFHQILGVAFFQFAQSMLKIFEQNFSWIIV